MKRTIAAILLCAVVAAAFPPWAQAQEALVLEAENAVLSGTNRVIVDDEASNGYVVGQFSEDGDLLSFVFEIDRSGYYDLRLRTKGIGTEKFNAAVLDGAALDEIHSEMDQYGEHTFEKVYLANGQHELTIRKGWGWIWVDALTVSLSQFPALYEAEEARLFGSITSVEDRAASHGKAVGRFSESGDKVIFAIQVPQDGYYDLSFKAKGIGGDKSNYVLADGVEIGRLDCAVGEYQTDVLRNTPLTAGVHEIEVAIRENTGWFWLDNLKVTRTPGLDASVYETAPTLCNPHANEETRQLYELLRYSFGRYCLSGQVCKGGLNGEEFRAVHAVSGKTPAILGLDLRDYGAGQILYGEQGDAVEKAIEFHNAGGLVSFSWHWFSPHYLIDRDGRLKNDPSLGYTYYTDRSDLDLRRIMRGEDPAGKLSLDLDIMAIASQLKRLEENHVPVLWRPLHEGAGQWFWWGGSGPEIYKEFWVYLYQQLTEVYHCDNLIWVWSSMEADWYPGDNYVDVIGDDIYAAPHQYTPSIDRFTALSEISPQGKIIALTENGVLPETDGALQANAGWAWFCTWEGKYAVADAAYSSAYTEADFVRDVYNRETVITLDELPALWQSAGQSQS